MSRFVSQKEVASALQITDRRVRQLEAEFIIPPARDDGRYDLDLCVERFGIYKNGRSDDLTRLHAEIEHDSAALELRVNEGPRAASTLPEIRETVGRVQHLFAALRFTLVCERRTDDFARQAMLEKLHRMESEALGVLVTRSLGLYAEEQGIPSADLFACLAAQCAAEPVAAEIGR